MKINKLNIILACIVSALSANSYAWHNELPKGGFNICNKTGKEIKMDLSHFHNVKWQVPDGSGWNTKKDYVFANNQCGILQMIPDWGGVNEHTRLYAEFTPTDGSKSGMVGFDFRSYTHEEYEKEGADRNQINVWNVMSYRATGDWSAEALVDKSVRYSRDGHCVAQNDKGICIKWKYTYSNKQNGSGLLNLADYGTHRDNTSLFTAPGDVQEIDIITKDNPSGLPEQKLGNVVYSLFNNKLSSQNKASVLENVKGRNINWANHPNASLCKVYGIAIDKDKAKIVNEKTTESSFSPLEPIVFGVNVFENSTKDPVIRTTAPYNEAKQEARIATLTSGWKWGVSAKLSAKFSILLKEGSWELSTNYEYNQGVSDTHSITETKAYTLPSQNITIPPGKKVVATAKLDYIQISSKFYFDYDIPNPTVRADVALDGNCNGAIEPATINTYNLLKNIKQTDLIEGVSANPNPKVTNRILLNGQGKLSGKNGFMFTLKEDWSDIGVKGIPSKTTTIIKEIPLDSYKAANTKAATTNPFGK